MELKDKILERIKELEENLAVYETFVNDKSNPEDDRKVAAFKLFYDLVSYSALTDVLDGYEALPQIKYQMAVAFKGVTGYVNVVDGKVVISDEYRELLKMKDEFLKINKN